MKSKEPRDNLIFILIIFFGSFVGCIFVTTLSLIFFLFYKQKIKNCLVNDEENLEPTFSKSPNSIYTYSEPNSKRKKFQNILHVKKLLDMKKNHNKNIINKTRVAECCHMKYPTERKSICQNNNTHFSDLKKTMTNTFKISDSSSKESLIESSSLNEMDYLANNTYPMKSNESGKFKPLCTSSPLLKLIQKSSHNTTFNFKQSITESDCNTDSELSSIKNQTLSKADSCVNVNEKISDFSKCCSKINKSSDDIRIKIPNIISMVSNKEVNEIKSDSEYFNRQPIQCIGQHQEHSEIELNLFDHKFISESHNVENYQSFNKYFSDIRSTCCRKFVKQSESLSSSHELLNETFSPTITYPKYGCFMNESVTEQFISHIEIHYGEVRSNLSVYESYKSIGLYHSDILYLENSLSLAISKISSEDKNLIFLSLKSLTTNFLEKLSSEIVDEKNLSILFDNSFDECLLIESEINFQQINQLCHSSNDLKVNFDFNICEIPLSIEKNSQYIYKLSFPEVSWKGRSRKIIKNS